MQKAKKKIYRKYEDFYTADDLRDPDIMPHLNLTISDFDSSGRIVNPRAPCVVTTIDPNYSKDARQQRLVKKFRMKTDILQLREITRKKFMIYATQQMHLEKQRETEHQDEVYKRLMDFYKFAEECLQKMESRSFQEMMKMHEKLKSLQNIRAADELKAVIAEHQNVQMQMKEVYRRFLYLLKLISYFDDIEGDNNNGVLPKPPEIIDFDISNENSADRKQTEQLKEYMQQIVRPYLARRNHLNPDIWLKGYEQTRHKIFNYNRRFTNLAMLNYIVTVVYEKFKKTYEHRIVTKPILIDGEFMKKRVESLKQGTELIFTDFERAHKKNKLSLKLNGIVPVILKCVQETISKPDDPEPVRETIKKGKKQVNTIMMVKSESALSEHNDEQETTLVKVEKIQAHLLLLLNQFDALPTDLCKKIEKRVRRRMFMEKEMSRRALAKQNRLNNWMEHFKKHELEKRKY